MEKNIRYHSLDSLKLIAIFCIVCIHTNPFSGYYFGGVDGTVVDNFLIDSLSRFAVPFFFMASGFLFIIKCTNEVYFKKYVINLIKLFITWALIYFLAGGLIVLIENLTNRNDLLYILNEYLFSSISISLLVYGEGLYSAYHLWFLVSLIWSIIVVYFFYKYKKNKLLLYLSLLLNFLGLLGQSYKGFLGIELGINTREVLFFGLFYTNLGAFFALNLENIVGNLKR
ncbi:acyltransferase family protein [Exiguobacterium sp. s142]|uniref:acyltransferase family protein n=1 Tax=Exiguobacterium sp. s142 TaxID=2751222 RepID=UPI001BED001A|nr:acyltransferase family protein [Exiguobacterium sp. s142]